jgi:glutathione S-transferase
MITLYEFPLSGNCHKIRLMLSLLNIDYISVKLNGAEREQKSAEYLAKNPFGQVPVLQDGELFIRDSQAILVYLAKQYGGNKWWSDDAKTLADITAWLSTTANEVARGPNNLRLFHKFGRNINLEDAEQVSNTLFNVIENHFSQHEWLVNNQVSIADIALYPYIALAREGHVNLDNYPATTQWLKRIQALPNYVSMPGI